MKVGIIVATKIERSPFEEAFKEIEPKIHMDSSGFDVMSWDFPEGLSVVLIRSNPGQVDAASATQYLICQYKVDKIIHYGAVDGLSGEYPAQTVGHIERVYHYGMWRGPGFKEGEYPGQGTYMSPKEEALDLSSIELPGFICASGDRVVLKGDEKIVARNTNADVWDMESAAVLRTCNRNNIPVTLIKAISGGLDDDEDSYLANVRHAAKACVELLIEALNLPTA